MNVEPSNFKITDIKEGDCFSFEEDILQVKVDQFASLTGDYNSLHMDEGFARRHQFKGRVAHGILLAGLFSRLVGMYIPGENGIMQSMNIYFVLPAYIGDRILVKGCVDQISTATKTIILKASIERIPQHEVLVRSKIQIGFTN